MFSEPAALEVVQTRKTDFQQIGFVVGLLTFLQGRPLLVLATATEKSVMEQLSLFDKFNGKMYVPPVNTHDELAYIMQQSGAFSEHDIQRSIGEIQDITGKSQVGVGIKNILVHIDTAKQDEDKPGRFAREMAEDIATSTAWQQQQ
jgi:vesicle-fusing ATPase